MVVKFVKARCLNCKREVKDEQAVCACGDPVRIGPPHPRTRAGLDTAAAPVTPTPAPGPPPRPDRALWDGGTTSLNIQLTGEQERAIRAVQDWFEQDPGKPFRLFGPAGTGKTTLARHLVSNLSTAGGSAARVVFGAYTGKAAHVLRRKGVPAETIHSSIYMLDPQMKLRARRWDAMRELAELQAEGNYEPMAIAALQVEIEDIEAKLRRPAFSLNELSEWAYADLIVLDEVSMVNESMARDIESFGVPVLVLGDPAQLPPIDGAGHYTASEPDVLLTEVHRQALESPVLKLATDVRLGRGWSDALVKVDMAAAMEADQVLCWKNATRWNLIKAMRKRLGRPEAIPVPGDRVMCLVNNKDIGVLNGQQYEVVGVQDGETNWVMDLKDDDGQVREILARKGGFQSLETEQAEKRAGAWRGESGLFTFANAITVHKAQGSEWPSVYVVDQTHQMTRSTAAERRAWVYTAITRASETVTLASTEVRG